MLDTLYKQSLLIKKNMMINYINWSVCNFEMLYLSFIIINYNKKIIIL